MGKERKLSTSDSSDSDIEVKKSERKSKKSESKKPRVKKFSWVWILPFSLLWLGLLYGVVIRSANDLPTALTIQTEHTNKGRFIAERAEQILVNFTSIGEKIVGSDNNEVKTFNFILDEIRKIRSCLNTDLFTLEVDQQEVSGAYIYYQMVNMYQGLQNIAVKLSSKSSDSTSYLLINTHFDTKPRSPGAGDAGTMVAVMLEVLRVLATGETELTHPIVFLFNSCEEYSLLASHGFITQHKWAANCKAVINLDSAGSGNRDILFQSGPNNPWLMKYYKQYAVHPYATTVGEELFQMNIIPSDTDFRIFTNYGNIPGLDIVHAQNDYVYHTKYDRAEIIPRGTFQNTGDNILSLAKAFADAPELEDPSKYATGSSVFFDVLGKYLVFYTNAQAIQINYGVSIVAVLAVFFSISFMSGSSKVTFVGVLGRFILAFIVNLIGLVLGVGLTVGLSYLVDYLGIQMSWFTFKWMVLGLYYSPFIFGLGLPTAVLIGAMKNDKLSPSLWTQLVLNSQLIAMALLTAGITYYGIKSVYLFMLATLFYTLALIFNTFTTLFRRGNAWFFTVVLLQIPAFLYITYLGYILSTTLIPMMGRFGSKTNPDLYISGLSALVSVLALGFIVPLVNLFRKPKLALTAALLITLGFIGIALSSYGFPFRPATNVQRFEYVHVRRVFHEVDNTVSKNESGYYFNVQDRREFTTLASVFDTSKLVSIADQCAEYMFCGLPVYNHRWNNVKLLSKWLPSGDTVLPAVPTLKLLSKTADADFLTVRFDFELDVPEISGIFLGPLTGSNITDWSFLNTMLVDNWAPPFYIHLAKGKDQSPLKFYVKFEKTQETFDGPTFEIGIGGHYVSTNYERSAENAAFTESFPAFTIQMEWPSSYERWIY